MGPVGCLSLVGGVTALLVGTELGFDLGESFLGMVDPATPIEFVLLGMAPIILSIHPNYKISKGLYTNYQDRPLISITAHLLLGFTFAIVNKFINSLILSLAMSTMINPLTVPVFLGIAGVSLLVLLALCWISRPDSALPELSIFAANRRADDHARRFLDDYEPAVDDAPRDALPAP